MQQGEVFYLASVCSSHGETQVLSTCYSMFLLLHQRTYLLKLLPWDRTHNLQGVS